MGRTESPNLKKDYKRALGLYGNFNKSEMALFSECMHRYAQKLLDTADIVREAMLRQQLTGPPAGIVPPAGLPTKTANEGLVAGSVDCRPPKCSNFSTR
jgi:hypothetical protein